MKFFPGVSGVNPLNLGNDPDQVYNPDPGPGLRSVISVYSL